ncbi:DNA repair protein RadC [Sphingomonas histidinilytica]|nr:DNA repair protein RadC [Rhizorhabdus histidinilytica]
MGLWQCSCGVDLSHADRAGLRGPLPSSQQEGWRLVLRLIQAMKPIGASAIVDRLIVEFTDASTLLFAGPARLERALPQDRAIVDILMASRELFLHSLEQRISWRPILADDRAVLDYLVARMAHQPAEQARVLYLNTKNELLRDEIVARGSVNRVDISPREIIRRALDISATGLLLAHNHPSGDPTPSASDVALTRDLFQAARLFEIALLDHIIVARQGYYSFRAEGRL